MFSAINWKGQHPNLMAILVADGPWTNETLKTLAKVFDYVIPITSVAQMATSISSYINGDKSKLKWLINFSIKENKI